MAARSFELLQKLQQWGVYFPVDENGKFRDMGGTFSGRVVVPGFP